MGTRISQFTPLTTVASADYFPLVQASDTTNKRVSLASLLASVPLGSAATPSIAFTGDTNTGIFSPGADQVAISTNGTSRLHITSGGLVGIGNSSPGDVLDTAAGNYRGISIKCPTTAHRPTLSFLNTADSLAAYIQATGSSLAFGTMGTDYGGHTPRMTLTSTGLGIGTTSPGSPLTIESSAGNQVKITYPSIASYFLNATSGGDFAINKDGTERLRIDSSGRLLVGTSNARGYGDGNIPFVQVERATIGGDIANIGVCNNGDNGAGPKFTLAKSRSGSNGGVTVVQNGDSLGSIQWSGADGTDIESVAAQITCNVDGTPGANDMPGRLVFSTTADGASSPTERMRIDSSGRTGFGVAPNAYGDDARITIQGTNVTRSIFSNINGTGSGTHITFGNGNGGVGSITTSGSSTAYNTSSDYRLKENVASVTDGITRLQQLKPSRFNFIVDPDKTVDGFLAHEVQTVVPEAITGEKDAVDADGNPVYQGIDQSKLVPLLTAALQEAIGRIETLEAEVAALKAQ